MNHERSCGAVLFTVRDGVPLYVLVQENYYGFPKGHMEAGETERKTAIREIREETGLEVKLDYLVGVYHNRHAQWPSGDKAHVVCAVYKASILSGEPRIDDESLELRFFSKEDLPELPSEDYREALRDYFQGVRTRVL